MTGELAQRPAMAGAGVTDVTAPAPALSERGNVAPYPRIDILKASASVPGLDDLESDRTQLAGIPAPRFTQQLATARAAFRVGDLAMAHEMAVKISRSEPSNAAARRLAVSTACKLGDKDYVTSVWPDLSASEQRALSSYCATTPIDLPGLKK